MARKATPTRTVRCYLCGRTLTVSMRAMSTTCPGCNKAIKIEDVVVKSYIPVVDLQTCGMIRITKRGRVAAKRIQCGGGIDCEGAMEGAIETEGDVRLGPKAFWKGRALQSRSLSIAPGARLIGAVRVPWTRSETQPAPPPRPAAAAATATATKKKAPVKKKAAAKKKKTSVARAPAKKTTKKADGGKKTSRRRS